MNNKNQFVYMIFIKLLIIFIVSSCDNNEPPDKVFVAAEIETVNGDTQASIGIFTNPLNMNSGISGALVTVNDTPLVPFFLPGWYTAVLQSPVDGSGTVDITIEFTDAERDGSIVTASEQMPAVPTITSPVQNSNHDTNEEITLEWNTVVPNPDSIQVSVDPLYTLLEEEYYGSLLPGDAIKDDIPPDILEPGNTVWTIDLNVSSINSSTISGDIIENGSMIEVKNTGQVGIYTNSVE